MGDIKDMEDIGFSDFKNSFHCDVNDNTLELKYTQSDEAIFRITYAVASELFSVKEVIEVEGDIDDFDIVAYIEGKYGDIMAKCSNGHTFYSIEYLQVAVDKIDISCQLATKIIEGYAITKLKNGDRFDFNKYIRLVYGDTIPTSQNGEYLYGLAYVKQ